jgi:2-dehydro-3-deoxy-D-arabinonate dehydratase
MKLCRFTISDNSSRIGISIDSESVIDLTNAQITSLSQILEQTDPVSFLEQLDLSALPKLDLASVKLLPPVDRQEVWAAGVTYFRSKTARMEESDFSATAYDKVYDAPRPEIFFKSVPEKVVGPDTDVGIRKDATWNVPEPELALIINRSGSIVGYTIGNDMSSRDIEGENLLYLPQAKVYDKSCALGPWIVLGTTEAQAREWEISIRIDRNGKTEFSGSTSIDQIKRQFSDLAEYLYRSQSFPNGAILLTGTGVVPDDSFTLEEGDQIHISISGIGSLSNRVCRV